MLEFLIPLLQTGLDMYAKSRESRALKQASRATPAEQSVNEIYRAIIDPESALLRRLTEQQRLQNTQDFLSQLRAMQLSDRRQASMGRTGTFFNPERADEAFDFLISRGLPQLNSDAERLALTKLTAGAQGLGGLIDTQTARNNKSVYAQLRGAEGVARTATGLPELFQQIRGQAQPTPYVPNGRQPITTYFPNLQSQMHPTFGMINWNR